MPGQFFYDHFPNPFKITFPPCTETLMELFRDNHNLLNTISDDQIIFFIFRLRNSGRVSRYDPFENQMIYS